jgi:hypothetical protein
MKIGQLFQRLDRDQVVAALISLYPRQAENRPGFESAWIEIRDATPRQTDAKCVIDFFDPGEGVPRLVRVYGRRGDAGDFALEFSVWEDWLDMDIVLGEGLLELSPQATLAHVFRAMTFHGFDREQITRGQSHISILLKDIARRLISGEPERPN